MKTTDKKILAAKECMEEVKACLDDTIGYIQRECEYARGKTFVYEGSYGVDSITYEIIWECKYEIRQRGLYMGELVVRRDVDSASSQMLRGWWIFFEAPRGDGRYQITKRADISFTTPIDVPLPVLRLWVITAYPFLLRHEASPGWRPLH